MILEYIRYRVSEAKSQEFEAAYARAAVPLAESKHCVDFELSQCVEEPALFMLRIRWDSLEGHMQGFRGSPEFRRFFPEIRPFVDAIEEMQHYEVTPVAGQGACVV